MSKMIRKTFVAVLLIALFTCSAITAQAHEAVDMTRDDCTLTIEMKYAGKPVVGGTLTLHRVGDIVESNGNFGFKWKDELNCTVGMDNFESDETAANISECVSRQRLDGTTITVDSNGEVVFNDLEVGLYLVRQKLASPGFSTIKPFLISLPQWDDNHYIYSVTAIAKTEMHKPYMPDNPPEDTEEISDDPVPEGYPPDNSEEISDNPSPGINSPNNPEPKLPQTGQLNWPVPLLAVFGVVFLVVGFTIRRRKNDA